MFVFRHSRGSSTPVAVINFFTGSGFFSILLTWSSWQQKRMNASAQALMQLNACVSVHIRAPRRNDGKCEIALLLLMINKVGEECFKSSSLSIQGYVSARASSRPVMHRTHKVTSDTACEKIMRHCRYSYSSRSNMAHTDNVPCTRMRKLSIKWEATKTRSNDNVESGENPWYTRNRSTKMRRKNAGAVPVFASSYFECVTLFLRTPSL